MTCRMVRPNKELTISETIIFRFPIANFQGAFGPFFGAYYRDSGRTLRIKMPIRISSSVTIS